MAGAVCWPHVALGLWLMAILPHDLLEGHTQFQYLQQGRQHTLTDRHTYTHTSSDSDVRQALRAFDMT